MSPGGNNLIILLHHHLVAFSEWLPITPGTTCPVAFVMTMGPAPLCVFTIRFAARKELRFFSTYVIASSVNPLSGLKKFLLKPILIHQAPILQLPAHASTPVLPNLGAAPITLPSVQRMIFGPVVCLPAPRSSAPCEACLLVDRGEEFHDPVGFRDSSQEFGLVLHALELERALGTGDQVELVPLLFGDEAVFLIHTTGADSVQGC